MSTDPKSYDYYTDQLNDALRKRNEQIAALEARLALAEGQRDDCLALSQAHLRSMDLLTDHVDAAERARAEAEGQRDVEREMARIERQKRDFQFQRANALEQELTMARMAHEVHAKTMTDHRAFYIAELEQAARTRAERLEEAEGQLRDTQKSRQKLHMALTELTRAHKDWHDGVVDTEDMLTVFTDVLLDWQDNDAVRAQAERLERLEGALRWYADKENYWPGLSPSTVMQDCGSRARAALSGGDRQGEKHGSTTPRT